MTVQEMIDALNKVKDKNSEVIIPSGYRKVTGDIYISVTEDYRYADCHGHFRTATRIYLGE